MSSLLVLVTVILTTADESHNAVFAQNSTSTLDNGTNVGIHPNTESIDNLLTSGDNEYDLGNYTGAIEYYDKILGIDPNDVDALNNKGVALDNLGNYTGAIEYYDKVLGIDPNDVDALDNKEVALDNLGQSTDDSDNDSSSSDDNNDSNGESDNDDNSDESDSEQDETEIQLGLMFALARF